MAPRGASRRVSKETTGSPEDPEVQPVWFGQATPGLGRPRSAWDPGCWVPLPTRAQRVGFWRCWRLRPCGNVPLGTAGRTW